MDILTIPYPNISHGLVHEGFYNAWNTELKEAIMDSIQILMQQHKNKSILITGHSSGGALSQICALYIKQYALSINHNPLIYLYTFGSPRLFNKVMADYFKTQIAFHWRVVNQKDLIPTLPYRVFNKNAFHHTATQIWYTSNKPLTYKQCDGTGEDPACSYIGYSKHDHVNYLNIHEKCD